jgi:hypothetical protein
MVDWLASHIWGVMIVLALLLIGGYWLARPFSWREGEGSDTIVDDSNRLLDTDIGSLRHSFFWSSDFHPFFRLREWWQRERDKWRKD